MKKTFFRMCMALFLVIGLTNCKKDDSEPTVSGVIVTTDSISNITNYSVFASGNVNTDGSGELFAEIMEKGFVWSTSPNPTYNGNGCYNIPAGGAGYGAFSTTLSTGIAAGVTYYVRAFAKTKSGFTYGNELSFTTLNLLEPALTTDAVTSITNNSALCGGVITSDGGSAVVSRGVCWSTSANPTISDSKTVDGSGIGTFASSLTGLSSNTLYYVRAYATNSIGTAYGNQVNFTTKLGIGDSFEGGIIAYVLQPGDAGYDVNVQHGLIAAPSDQSVSAPWALTNTVTGATSQAMGTGQSNTNTIVADQGVGNYAAAICNDLVIGSYSDWYLPSMYELEKLYINRTAIGGFAIAFYWSSSEQDVNSAWLQSFNSNSQTAGTKTGNYYVRAVRSY